MCVRAHCSTPKEFMGNEIEISNLDILGKSLGPIAVSVPSRGALPPGT